MRTVGAYEAKTHLSQLLEEVSRGGQVAITRNGIPVALLVPVPSAQKPDTREVIRQLRELRRGVTLGGMAVQEMIEEGRGVPRFQAKPQS
jgi:prevent-host-death family protein